MNLAGWGKSFFLELISRLTGRNAVLLPRESAAESMQLAVSSPYRVTAPCLTLSILERSRGVLSVSLLCYEGHFPRRIVWERDDVPYAGPTELTIDLSTGEVRLGETVIGRVEAPLPTRRFACRLRLRRADRSVLSRVTGHYLPVGDAEVGQSYYCGADYVDYEAQAGGEASEVLSLLAAHGAEGPVLEIGSATGLVLEKLVRAGYDVTGLDFSSWAVEQARNRLGADRVFQTDVERDDLTPLVANRGPFRTLLLWAVLEHFRDPFTVLEKLARYAADGSLLVINTTNTESLSHRLFGGDWEGYFDWTHHGVERVSVDSIRRELPRLGWTIESLHTHSFWHSGADPDHAVLRETFGNDARFGRLLRSRDLGDFLVCVARKDTGKRGE